MPRLLKQAGHFFLITIQRSSLTVERSFFLIVKIVAPI